MTPRVSVVMPVYNGERFIADAVTSVLASTFTDFELLVVDDGSTDESIARVTAIAAGDARVRIARVPHGGVGAARNAGLREARGEFIANLDADDMMFPDRLARQVAFLDRHVACVAVGSRCLAVTATGQPTQVMGHLFVHEEIDAALLAGDGGAIGNEGAMFRRAAALAVGGYTTTLRSTGEDHDLWLRLAEVGQLASLPHVLTAYRVHGANVSLGPGSRERRLPITLDNLARAFARRGITGREPAKLAGRPLRASERWCNRALFLYHAGDRRRALMHAIVAVLLRPTHDATRSALQTILAARPPRWPIRA